VTNLQSASPGGSYADPAAGVITSWSFQAEDFEPSGVKFKVGRPAGGTSYTIVGESAPKNPAPSTLNTYTDVRIPVQPGDVIGYFVAVDGICLRGAPGYTLSGAAGDQPPGTTASYFDNGTPIQVNFSAALEPDADNDSFGDETQDLPLTLDASKNKVKKGKKVTLSGQIAGPPQSAICAANRGVELRRKRPKQSTFAAVEQVQTDAAGAFSLREKVKKTFEYRTQVTETAICAAAASNIEKVRAKKQR
jgi:hypothetical protein